MLRRYAVIVLLISALLISTAPAFARASRNEPSLRPSTR